VHGVSRQGVHGQACENRMQATSDMMVPVGATLSISQRGERARTVKSVKSKCRPRENDGNGNFERQLLCNNCPDIVLWLCETCQAYRTMQTHWPTLATSKKKDSIRVARGLRSPDCLRGAHESSGLWERRIRAREQPGTRMP
jgi:hypothetical protein